MFASYDPQSGQVFHETILAMRRTTRPWQYISSRGGLPKADIPRKGAPSLLDVATRSVVHNGENLTAAALQPVPLHLLEHLWQAVKLYGYECLYVWRVFAETGLDKSSFLCNKTIREPTQPLPEYISEIRSLRCSWLVNLTLADIECGTADLTNVAELCNLSNLRLWSSGRTPGFFDDNILRAWSRAASERRSFSRLQRLFILRMQDITANAFHHLAAFPALVLFSVTLCGIKRKQKAEAVKLGWRLPKESGIIKYAHELRLRSTSQNWKKSICWDQLIQGYLDRCHSRTLLEPDILPLLTVQLGSWYRDYGLEEDFRELLCFERGESVRPGVPAVTLREEDEHEEPQVKKRKLKDARSVVLEDVLAGL